MKKCKLLFKLTKKDFEVETFRGRGPGGQHRNRRDSCVRITHPASGAVATATEDRRQQRNRATAFVRLSKDPKFLAWLRVEAARARCGLDDLDDKVDGMMAPHNLLVEVVRDGKWTEW